MRQRHVDGDGLAAIAGARQQRQKSRAMQSLIGVLSGITCDGEINQTEATYLSTWLSENEETARSWPGSVIYRLVREVLADGYLSAEEAKRLCEQLQRLIGNEFIYTGSTVPGPLEAVIDDDPHIIFAGREFVFTGDVLYGTKAHCERLVMARGGVVGDTVTRRTNYVVIGSMGSPDWLHGNYGTKIQRAAELSESRELDISIVREADWVLAL
jgi:NAD-dependent DNA ligase